MLNASRWEGLRNRIAFLLWSQFLWEENSIHARSQTPISQTFATSTYIHFQSCGPFLVSLKTNCWVANRTKAFWIQYIRQHFWLILIDQSVRLISLIFHQDLRHFKSASIYGPSQFLSLIIHMILSGNLLVRLGSKTQGARPPGSSIVPIPSTTARFLAWQVNECRQSHEDLEMLGVASFSRLVRWYAWILYFL